MSFDLAVIAAPPSASLEEIRKLYAQLCAGDYDILPESERIPKFYAALTERFPDLADLDDEACESSPWSATIDISDGAVLLPISWSAADAMTEIIGRLAA